MRRWKPQSSCVKFSIWLWLSLYFKQKRIPMDLWLVIQRYKTQLGLRAKHFHFPQMRMCLHMTVPNRLIGFFGNHLIRLIRLKIFSQGWNLIVNWLHKVTVIFRIRLLVSCKVTHFINFIINTKIICYNHQIRPKYEGKISCGITQAQKCLKAFHLFLMILGSKRLLSAFLAYCFFRYNDLRYIFSMLAPPTCSLLSFFSAGMGGLWLKVRFF